METEPIVIEVEGTPKPWGNNQKGLETLWRGKIRDECSKHERIKEDRRLKVEVIFYLNKKGIIKSDLDNLAKPILDTICKVNNPQTKDKTLTGSLFNCDDNRVFELILKKEERDEEGAIIKIWRL